MNFLDGNHLSGDKTCYRTTPRVAAPARRALRNRAGNPYADPVLLAAAGTFAALALVGLRFAFHAGHAVIAAPYFVT